jgi:acyl-coenzyme A thioesterase PaaI-like protein
MRAMTDEEIEAMFVPAPPCSELLGWRLLAHDESRPAAGRHSRSHLVKSGGALYPPTINMNVSFLSAAKPGPLVCEAEVLRLGKTVGFVEGRLTDEDGRLLVRTTASVMLVPVERLAR